MLYSRKFPLKHYAFRVPILTDDGNYDLDIQQLFEAPILRLLFSEQILQWVLLAPKLTLIPPTANKLTYQKFLI